MNKEEKGNKKNHEPRNPLGKSLPITSKMDFDDSKRKNAEKSDNND